MGLLGLQVGDIKIMPKNNCTAGSGYPGDECRVLAVIYEETGPDRSRLQAPAVFMVADCGESRDVWV